MTETPARPEAPWALRLVPPFPAVAHRIMALVSREDADIHELQNLVKMDPSFSAELLRFANSGLFAVRGKVQSLSHAIMLVGMDRVKMIATFVVLNRMVRSSLRIEALRKVWTHCVVTAVVAEGLAEAFRQTRDSAYAIGLLHNLGTLGLMCAYPEQYSCMLEVNREFGFDLLQTERDLFEIDHCLAGEHLARAWDYPEEFAVAIRTHHETPVSGEASLANLVKVSWRLSDTLGYSIFPESTVSNYEDLIAIMPGASSTPIGQSREAALAEISARFKEIPK